MSSNEPVKNGCEVIYENCDDHGLLDFKIRSSIYGTFHISLHNNNNIKLNKDFAILQKAWLLRTVRCA